MGGIGYFNQIKMDALTGTFSRKGASLDFDLLEVINGFELADPEALLRNAKSWFSLLQAGLPYVAVGNSDSHHLKKELVGYPRTYVKVPRQPADADTLLANLRAGRAFVTTGPIVEARLAGLGPGDRAILEDGHGLLEIAVRAPRWIDVTSAEIWINGKQRLNLNALKKPTSALRLKHSEKLAFKEDSWLVVVVKGQRPLEPVLPGVNAPSFAFTNPIWIDADGDGALNNLRADAGGADASADSGAQELDAANRMEAPAP